MDYFDLYDFYPQIEEYGAFYDYYDDTDEQRYYDEVIANEYLQEG